MSCIRTALETCYYRIVACKNVNNLTFSFVAPLPMQVPV